MQKSKIYFTLILLLCFCVGEAQIAFTPGNIVVCRVGNGSGTLNSNAAPVFLDEFTPVGVLVRSLALPVTGLAGSDTSHPLTLNRSAFEGMISLSTDGRYIVVGGYDATVGTVGVTSNTTILRDIGLIKYDGTINTTTSLTDFASGSVPASVVSTNGNDIWVTCLGAATNTTGGIRYTTLGSTTSTKVASNDASIVNLRVLTIANNQLYVTGSTSSNFLGTVGTGLPTTPGQSITNLPGFDGNTSADQYAFFDMDPSVPGLDVLYLADQQFGSSGIRKYSLVGGSWVSNGFVTSTPSSYMGLAASISGTTVTIYATRQGANNTTVCGGELVKMTDASGYNGSFSGTPSVIYSITAALPNGFGYLANTAGFRGIALVPQAPSSSSKLSLKTFLQGAYSSGLGRHKDVTSIWANILDSNATSQPFNISAFGNYAGTESVSNSFFTSTAGTTDITDWILVELRDGTTPSNLVARRAGFIREDGQIVDVDGTSALSFTGVADGNYYVVVRHRNHLAIRSASTVAVSGGGTASYDFTTAQAQAYKDVAITTNEAMKDLSGGGTVFGMWAGNANSNTASRASGPNATLNDFLYLVNNVLGGNVATILGPPTGGPGVYNAADMNMDGSVRASGPNATVNDFLYLVNTVLSGNVATIITAHQ